MAIQIRQLCGWEIKALLLAHVTSPRVPASREGLIKSTDDASDSLR